MAQLQVIGSETAVEVRSVTASTFVTDARLDPNQECILTSPGDPTRRIFITGVDARDVGFEYRYRAARPPLTVGAKVFRAFFALVSAAFAAVALLILAALVVSLVKGAKHSWADLLVVPLLGVMFLVLASGTRAMIRELLGRPPAPAIPTWLLVFLPVTLVAVVGAIVVASGRSLDVPSMAITGVTLLVALPLRLALEQRRKRKA
jgi:hypothetical protein